jgi:hypothetical protein
MQFAGPLPVIDVEALPNTPAMRLANAGCENYNYI